MKYLYILWIVFGTSLGASEIRTIEFKHVTNQFFEQSGLMVKDLELRYRINDAWSEPLCLELEDQGFSNFLKYSGSSEVGVFRSGEGTPFTKFVIPEGRRWIFLFLATQNASRPYEVHLIQDETFKYGQYKVFNLTPTPVGLQLAGSKIIIRPNSSRSFALSDKFSNNTRFPVEFYLPEEKVYRRFSATQWSKLESKRSMVFIYRDPLRGRYVYKGVDDYFISAQQVAGFEKEAEVIKQKKRT